jgi:hypothetical protein
VTVILEKAGTAGALRVGDESNPDRYFNTADLVEKATVSSITEVRYDSADTLIVESLLSEGSSASVAIDFSIEC